jgi:hypothetical protein
MAAGTKWHNGQQWDYGVLAACLCLLSDALDCLLLFGWQRGPALT